MPLSAEHSAWRYWPVAALAAACFGITLWAFYPGVMTYDAKFVYEDMLKGFRGDWQSPVMTSLWGWIDPIAPGSGSMFLLSAGLYWLGFGLLAVAVARRSFALAVVLILLAASPSVLMFVAIIWRDVLFASLWLLAAALCFIVADRKPQIRVPVQAIALGLIALGVLLRPNALIAAPLVVAYAFWPTGFRRKRAAILAVPVTLILYGLIQVVYYGVLHAARQNIVQSIMVFDLGGISHFAQANQFPVAWSADEDRQLLTTCYKPTEWDIYSRIEPCDFVMRRLEKEQHLFGTPAVSKAWLTAIVHHPIAYAEHRAAFFWNFIARDNLTLWTFNIEDLPKPVLDGRKSFAAMEAVDRALKATPVLRVGSWLLLCMGVCVFAWRRRETPEGAFALGIAGSGALYVLTFLAVGVASDFRYGYWAAIAGISGAVTLATRRAP